MKEKYLGLPTSLRRSTDDQFELIVAKIKKIVDGGCSRLLSGAGREVMIKSVRQAFPTYSMSCFMLPEEMCKKITVANGKVSVGRR